MNGKVKGLLRLALTAATLAVLLWYLQSRPRAGIAWGDLRWSRFVGALALLPGVLGLRAYKWRVLLRSVVPAITFGQAVRSYLGGIPLGLVTPGRVGEFSRGLYLAQTAARGWRGAGLVLIDNWLDFLAVLAWAALGASAAYGFRGFAAGALALALFGPITFWIRRFSGLATRLPAARGLRDSLTQMLASGASLRAPGWLAAAALAFAAYGMEWTLAALLIGFLSPAAPAPWVLAGLLALVSLANSVQVTLGGMGIREGVSVALLARVGIPPGAAALAAFLQGGLVVFLPALFGLLVKPVPAEPAPASDPGRASGTGPGAGSAGASSGVESGAGSAGASGGNGP